MSGYLHAADDVIPEQILQYRSDSVYLYIDTRSICGGQNITPAPTGSPALHSKVS